MDKPVTLLGLATAVPPHILKQSDVVERARSIFAGRMPAFERLAQVFETAGIDTRQAVRPIDWYEQPRGWPERTQAYLDGACTLFRSAALAALEKANCRPCDVDIVVTVSSTGIATPSLEARVADELGLRPDVARVPVFGLGCAGGVTGLALAARLARAEPGRTVLMVTVELCTLSFRGDAPTKANIVATALFGDGAAAAVLRADGKPGPLTVRGAGEHRWPDTLGIMGWDIEDEGLGVIFDRSIPPFAEENIGPAVDGILRRLDGQRRDIGRFVCHPGGAKVIEALETGLALGQGRLVEEREVLRAHGNMSAPTVLFVLERCIAAGLPARSLVTAMGPGFTASAAILDRAA
ncbi:type III polyketide synthase [uncultured Alsobacter sp.]|uniref:type III polyketide synthase n=1 Tax=uncultured Alsobacter sp. TaxID=1748258 RepID=UPI0025CDF2B7|nr:type III polyketide synthase [uncultured Alsobacter sp.]